MNALPEQNIILDVEGLNIYYASFQAVKNLSFSVKKGEIFGLLGPNGAGKTSTLSAVEGLLKPRSGRIIVAGYDTAKNPLQARANMGMQLQSTSFQPELQVHEIIKLFGRLNGLELSKDEIAGKLEGLGLLETMQKKYAQLSGGQQQRLSLYIATMHDPNLVMLDEPTTGLDPQSRRQLWDRIESMKAKGHSILLTTHSMEEAEAVCDRIAIVDHGAVIEKGIPSALVEKYKDHPEVIKVSRKGKVTLEDVFIGLTGAAVRA
jgi:ABC-2 type transport system ATP-binding protein